MLRKTITVSVLAVFVAILTSCNSGDAGTRGIGVDPGRVSEYTGPEVVSGGPEYRNIALFRAAMHSSSWDYDHTAQLVTDGLLSNAPGA